jgi:ribonuclease HII
MTTDPVNPADSVNLRPGPASGSPASNGPARTGARARTGAPVRTGAGAGKAGGTVRGAKTAPTLKFERSFTASGHRYVAGCDEVGRGALAGPVSVGMVVIDISAVRALKGVRDSKLLSVSDREQLVPRIQRWAVAYGVGHASNREIDEYGLMAALRFAGNRAWQQVLLTVRPEVVILDGNHDWLSGQQQASLFEDPAENACDAPVFTKIKADLQCLSVAAASVLAKVERDAMMTELALRHPGYGWEVNKGYATESHRAAIAGMGPSAAHRTSWRLGTSFEPGGLRPAGSQVAVPCAPEVPASAMIEP